MKKLLLLLVSLFCLTSTNSYAQSADAQAIYTGADPTLPSIDVYFSIAGIPVTKLEDVDGGGDASTFVPVPAGVPIQIDVAPGSSTSSAEAVASFTTTLGDGTTNLVGLSGVLDPNRFAPNPDGRDISLNVFVFDQARQAANTANQLDLVFVHGTTDTPTLDLRIRGGALLAEDWAYGDFSAYTSLAPALYIFDVAEASSGSVIASFIADIPINIAGSAVSVGLLGFRDPGANQNGAPLRMVMLFIDGSAIELPATDPPVNTAIAHLADQIPTRFSLSQNHPNPFNTQIRIAFELPSNEMVSLAVYDVLGREVARLVDTPLAAGSYTADFNAKDLAAGVYVYHLQAGQLSQIRTMVLAR